MEKWDFRESNDGYSEEFPKGAGWYDCELSEIKQIQVPSNPAFWDVKKRGPMPEKQTMLLFLFKHDGLYEASRVCTPSMSVKSNMLKLLKALHGAELPDIIMSSQENYQAFAMSLIGSSWQLQISRAKNGKRNTVDSIGPKVGARSATPKLAEGDSDISAWDSGSALPRKLLYVLKGMAPDKVSKAEALLLNANGVKDVNLGGWVTTVEVPALKKYQTDLDEVPF